jgi:D-glycero-alpha-D-manno-heptose-7-phosphate kinase
MQADHQGWIGRTPLRVSFGGGGTDFEDYYARRDGFVVSTTVSLHVTAKLVPCTGSAISITHVGEQEARFVPGTESIDLDDPLSYTKKILDLLLLDGGYELTISSDLPMGTGLGSSGSMGVNLVGLLHHLRGIGLDRAALAETAYRIEHDDLGRATGKQDHYAAAFGGLNRIRFRKGAVTVEPLSVSLATRSLLQDRIHLFHTGVERNSSPIARVQQDSIRHRDRRVLRRLDRILELGLEIAEGLEAGDVDGVGDLLHRSWCEKKEVAGAISSTRIDELYEAARTAGALGGKICGAGGGGILMVLCPEESRERVHSGLARLGAREIPCVFDTEGFRLVECSPGIEALSGTGDAAGMPTEDRE